MLTLLFVLGFASSSLAGDGVLHLTLDCRGVDKINGHEVSFELHQKDFNGQEFTHRKIKKFYIGNEKQDAIDLTQDKAPCGNGEADYKFSLKTGEFKLKVKCEKNEIKASGTCNDALPNFDGDDFNT